MRLFEAAFEIHRCIFLVQSIWIGPGRYHERVSTLIDPQAPILNTSPGGNILHDGVEDVLDGDDGLDLFFAEIGIDDADDRRERDEDRNRVEEILIDQTETEEPAPTDTGTGVLSGFVWVDSDGDGGIDAQEFAIEGVIIELYDATDQLIATTQTDSQGMYGFSELYAGEYTIKQVQPVEFADGSATTENGGVVGPNQIGQISLDIGEVLTNFNFGEVSLPDSTIVAGQAATIGFWYSRDGKKLIKDLNGTKNAKRLGDYLAANFPNLFGDFAGLKNYQVRNRYVDSYKARFLRSENAEQTKLELEVFSLALATFVTDQSQVQINEKTGASTDTELVTRIENQGFLVTIGGVSNATYDLGQWVDDPYTEADIRATFGLADEESLVMTVMELLQATDAHSGSILDGEAYDASGDGIDALEQILRDIANSVYTDINTTGGV